MRFVIASLRAEAARSLRMAKSGSGLRGVEEGGDGTEGKGDVSSEGRRAEVDCEGEDEGTGVRRLRVGREGGWAGAERSEGAGERRVWSCGGSTVFCETRYEGSVVVLWRDEK